MKPEARRLLRLQRLEKLRDVAKQAAAREAAEAESTLAQLEALAARTGRLVADYASRTNAADGAELRGLTAFRSGLSVISQGASGDASRARHFADHKLSALAEAERRRQAVEDRARGEAQALARGAEQPVLGSRRGIGTPLE